MPAPVNIDYCCCCFYYCCCCIFLLGRTYYLSTDSICIKFVAAHHLTVFVNADLHFIYNLEVWLWSVSIPNLTQLTLMD